jgi:hypothetical protein
MEDINIDDIRQITRKTIDDKLKQVYDASIERINKSILSASNEGLWETDFTLEGLWYVYRSVTRLVLSYYSKKRFKIKQINSVKYKISWCLSNNFKKWKAVVNCIIFIRRLRESYLEPDGVYHKNLVKNYSYLQE